MGNFEKLSVLVIVVIIVMILVVALYTWTGSPESPTGGAGTDVTQADGVGGTLGTALPPSPVTTPPSTPIGTVIASPAPLPTPATGNRDGLLVAPPQPRSIRDIIDGVEGLPASPTPVVTTPPEAPRPAEPKIHAVEPGQTLGGIAKLHYPGRVQKGLQAIRTANPGVDEMRLAIGTKLTIPDLGAPADGAVTPASATPAAPKRVASIERGGWYVTKRGDTLTSISKAAYGTSERWPELWIENMDALGANFERPDAGIRIRIPR